MTAPKHPVTPMDIYDDMWRCRGCGKQFESNSGYAICPNAVVKGYIYNSGDRWFHYVDIDGVPHLHGDSRSWDLAVQRVLHSVDALRPRKDGE